MPVRRGYEICGRRDTATRMKYLWNQRAPGGGVRLRIDSGVRIDGSEVGLDLLFDLTDIARMGAVPSDGSA